MPQFDDCHVIVGSRGEARVVGVYDGKPVLVQVTAAFMAPSWEETSDVLKAASCVAGPLPDGRWVAIDLEAVRVAREQ